MKLGVRLWVGAGRRDLLKLGCAQATCGNPRKWKWWQGVVRGERHTGVLAARKKLVSKEDSWGRSGH